MAAAAFVRGALESPAALASRLRMAPSASSLLRASARRPGGQQRRRGRELVVALCKAADPVAKEAKAATDFTSVMKFGGSSVASAERMSEAAALILSFPEEMPVVLLSAMGRTNNNLLLAGEKAVKCKSPSEVSGIHELLDIKQLHLRTVDDLGLDRSILSGLLDHLEQLLNAIATVKELTPRTRDKLVSFGTCMSTRIFAAYLNELGKKSRQYDAFDIGFTTTDDFTNAAILEATYPAVAKRLQGDLIDDPAIPIVTDSLGMGQLSQAITTLGSGGSDLTAMTISKALGLRENQVWKYVDGLLTRDPNIYANMKPITNLTSDAATELADFREQIYSRMKKTEDNKEFMAYMSSWYMANILSLVMSRMRRQAVMLTGGTLFLTGFITLAIYPAAPIISTILLVFGVGLTAQALCSQSMQPAGEGDIPSPFITKARDRSKSILTSIVLKPNVVVLEIVSTKIDDQYGFLPKVLSICEDFNISMDYVAANEVSVLLALNPSKLWSREFIQKKLDDVIAELEDIGVVRLMAFRSIISLTGNVQRSSLIHEKAFNVLHRNGVKFMIHMISQGPSKVNISLVVHHNEAKQCVEALRSEFFENGFSPKAKAEEDVPLNGSALNPNGAI